MNILHRLSTLMHTTKKCTKFLVMCSSEDNIFLSWNSRDTSNYGPQYSSEEFCCFSVSYDFTHATSSPYYPRGNGESERAVRTVKNFLKDSNDPHIALLTYRATSLPWCGISPAELLMGRKLRTNVPESEVNFTPQWPNLQKFRTELPR